MLKEAAEFLNRVIDTTTRTYRYDSLTQRFVDLTTPQQMAQARREAIITLIGLSTCGLSGLAAGVGFVTGSSELVLAGGISFIVSTAGLCIGLNLNDPQGAEQRSNRFWLGQ